MRAHTLHADIRKQQRAIPNIVEMWLDEFGDEEHDHHGGVRIYFSKRSVRNMERAYGAKFVRENKKYLNAYKVESFSCGITITMGWLH